MRYRKLGKTGLEVSEIGLGAEWLERHDSREIKEVIDTCETQGINILDCWMSEPNVRSNRTPGEMDYTGTYRFHMAERTVRAHPLYASGESRL